MDSNGPAPTLLLRGLAIAYLVFGAMRGRLRRPGVLRLEIVGLVVFGGCALLAVLVDPRTGQYVAGLAWIGHAAWDVAHHRDLSRHPAVGVVPRGYAELCIVLDLLIGASLIAAPVADSMRATTRGLGRVGRSSDNATRRYDGVRGGGGDGSRDGHRTP